MSPDFQASQASKLVGCMLTKKSRFSRYSDRNVGTRAKAGRLCTYVPDEGGRVLLAITSRCRVVRVGRVVYTV